jgi:hypothetical protein
MFMVVVKRKRIDWLQIVDAASSNLPRARSWIYYPWFFFARYPHLRPVESIDPKQQSHLESCHEAFKREVWRWQDRIGMTQNAWRVLYNLEGQHRFQLGALMVDCEADLKDYTERLPYHKLLKKFASEEPRRERMLKRKLASVHEATDRLIRELSSSDCPRAYALNHMVDHYRRAEEDLENYLKKFPSFIKPRNLLGDVLPNPGSITLPDLVGLLNTPGFHVVPENPVAPCMIKLYWFFHHGCGISGNQSEIRVALLRNAFWQTDRFPRVGYKEIAGAEGSAECGAVKRAVQRYSTRLPSE